MSYAERYLSYADRDQEGWPLTENGPISQEEKTWLTENVREVLRTRPLGLSIMEMHTHLRQRGTMSTTPVVWNRAVVYDYSLALVHRALLASGADQVWRF